jgi:FkbM family methyltransferase
MRSFSQNLEDVLLNRCFGDQIEGTYIDVGAGPHNGYSVTKNLYLQGWSGLLIEPVPEYANGHRQNRPRDKVVEVVVGEKDGTTDFLLVPTTGLSTTNLEIADSLKDIYQSEVISLPELTLNTIFARENIRTIDLLKLDIEGSELLALKGLDFNLYQPRIIIVEATIPMTATHTDDSVHNLLISVGYTFALFDGLNDYYVFNGDQELLLKLASPVNIFDGDYFKRAEDFDNEITLKLMDEKAKLMDEKAKLMDENRLIQSELDSVHKNLEWHRENLYVVNNSKRMRIGNFVVKLLLPFKSFFISAESLIRLVQRFKARFVLPFLDRLLRNFLDFRINLHFIVAIRVTKSRLFGFWGWNNYKVFLKNLLLVVGEIKGVSKKHFDSERLQTLSGVAQLGFSNIEVAAFETLKRDLDGETVSPRFNNTKISQVIMDVRCVQAPGLSARGIGKHASFIIKEINYWADSLNLEVLLLSYPELKVPDFLNSNSLIYVLPENTDGTIYINLSSMTENPLTSLPVLLNKNAYKVGVFYDFIPRHNRGYYLWGRSAKALYDSNLSSLNFYDEFWPISNSVAGELKRFLNFKDKLDIEIIPTGVSAKIPIGDLQKSGLSARDIIIPTGGDARKDPITAIAALVLLKNYENIGNIVVIGRLPLTAQKEILSIARGTWLYPNLQFLTPESFNDIAMAYKNSQLTLVTSLDEGYSLPVVESVDMHIPVIASNIPAHAELLKIEYLFKRKNYRKLARKISRFLESKDQVAASSQLNLGTLLIPEKVIPNRLNALGHNLIFEVKKEKVGKRVSSQPVSVITPWPPLKSGIADYSASTLKEPELTIICSDAHVDSQGAPRIWNWCDIAKSKRLFVIGNNHNFHSSAIYALQKMGGNALVHDVRLLDFWMNLFGPFCYEYLNKYADLSRDSFDQSFINLDASSTLGFEPLVPSVHRFITHSSILRDHLLSIGSQSSTCVPFAARLPEKLSSFIENKTKETLTLGVFGITDISTKHFDLIFDACADLVKEFPLLKLIVVGETLNDVDTFLSKNGRRQVPWINIFGRVNEEQYWNLLSTCTMTIHVRKVKMLSLSGAVIDSLVAGTPVVCSEAILDEMQIPSGLPFSVPVRGKLTLDNLREQIRCGILSVNQEEFKSLSSFAENRSPQSYLKSIKVAIGL